MLHSTKCGVVHCASSNFMLKSGVLDVRPLLDKGIKVALGTDIAGGYSPSMLDALRQVNASFYRCFVPYYLGCDCFLTLECTFPHFAFFLLQPTNLLSLPTVWYM